MIFIDSWVWLEFFQEDEKSGKAEKVLEMIEDEGAVISSTVLMKVRYRIKSEFGEQKADKLTSLITSFENLDVAPVTEEVAVLAADLREKYYQRSDQPISYADTIHLATAAMTDCEKLYTGDPDFEGLDEVETRVI